LRSGNYLKLIPGKRKWVKPKVEKEVLGATNNTFPRS
jgi:hypothetical protein